jgi:hypothetical protein
MSIFGDPLVDLLVVLYIFFMALALFLMWARPR